MGTTLPFNYAHMWEEMFKGIDEQGPYYEVIYLFDDWANSDAIINDLLGVTTYTNATTFRGLPHQHPLSPNLYCRSARCEGMGGPVLNGQGYPKYDSGFKIRATYRIPVPFGAMQTSDDPNGLQQIDPDTPLLWCSQELDFDTDWHVLPTSQLKYQSDGMYAGIPAKIQVGVTTMILTFHRVPFMPATKIKTYRGRTNNATFLGSSQDCVLYSGGKVTREWSTDGTVNQKVQLTFRDRDQGWSKVPRRDNPNTWDTLVDGSSNPLFQQANLTALLQIFFG
jgi:hypothetical protein